MSFRSVARWVGQDPPAAGGAVALVRYTEADLEPWRPISRRTVCRQARWCRCPGWPRLARDELLFEITVTAVIPDP